MEELDILLNDLGKGLETGGSGGSTNMNSPKSQVDISALGISGSDNDKIKNRLKERRISRRVSRKPTGARPTSAIEDLDSLMRDLGGSPPPQRQSQQIQPQQQQRQSQQISSSSDPIAASALADIDSILSELDINDKSGSPSQQQQQQNRNTMNMNNNNRNTMNMNNNNRNTMTQTNIPRRTTTVNSNARSNPPPEDLNTLLGSLKADPRTVPANSSNIDYTKSMMSGLRSQMQNLSSSGLQAARGTCFTCNEPIYEDLFQALGKTFHSKCFTCGNCSQALQTANFFNVDGTPHCLNCYQLQFCPRCAHCNKAIQGGCIEAMGKKWHPNCFGCTQCQTPFGTNMFYEHNGTAFCANCFAGLFSNRCGECNSPIIGECVTACGKQYHPDHFVCKTCKKAFGTDPYYERDGAPYCKFHFHSQVGSVCACGCGNIVMGRCISALGKKYLPEHFLCAFCCNPLAGIKYTERDGAAYCDFCVEKLFGK